MEASIPQAQVVINRQIIRKLIRKRRSIGAVRMDVNVHRIKKTCVISRAVGPVPNAAKGI